MANAEQNNLSVNQAIQSIAAHKALAIVCFVTVMALVVLLYICLPREYDSQGQIFVQLGRGNVGLNPSPDSTISIQDSRETEIRSVVELLGSRGLLEEVAKKVTPERILANTFEFPIKLPSLSFLDASSETKWDNLPEDYEVLKKREKAVRKLAGDIKISSEKKTSVVSITCSAGDPMLAQEIVDALMEGVQKIHVDVHRVEQSTTFFESEFNKQESELLAAQKTLQHFRNTHRFLSVGQARDTHQHILDKLENQRVDLQIDLKQSRRRIASMISEMETVPELLMVPESGFQSLSTEGAHEMLHKRVAEQTRLRSRYSETHPKVQTISDEIAGLRKDIATLPTQRTQVLSTPSKVYEALKIDLVKEQALAESVQARFDKVESSYTTALQRLVELNGLQVDEEQLVRDVATAKQFLGNYVTKRGEAYINDQLDRSNISDVVIAQKGSLILKKSSPRGSILLPIGAILATFVSLAACMWSDRKKYLETPVSCDIEEVLDLPILVTIPRVHASRLLMN